jgi:hypothetical protein
MVILTHEGPGYRSKLMSEAEARAFAERLRGDTQYTGVHVLESTRARSANRCFVVCQPACPEKRAALLQQLQQDRLLRALEEGPGYVWLADPAQPVWHVLSLSGECYAVSTEPASCTCRDAGVCADTGLFCKHVAALQQGLGVFVTPAQFQRLQQLAASLGQPAAEREPVALPVAA